MILVMAALSCVSVKASRGESHAVTTPARPSGLASVVLFRLKYENNETLVVVSGELKRTLKKQSPAKQARRQSYF